METFTPNQPQRNRRAGRMSAGPDGQAEPMPVQQPTPMQQSLPVQQPMTAQQPVPVSQPVPGQYPLPMRQAVQAQQAPQAQLPVQPQQPYVPRSAAPAPQPASYPRTAHADGLSAAHAPRASSAYAACPPQPAARRTAQSAQYNPAPRSLQTAQPAARPRAAGDARALRMDDPDARRAARQQKQPRPEPPKEPTKSKKEPPAEPLSKKKGVSRWIQIVFPFVLVGVLLLLAITAIKMAELKTLEKEKQKAWEETLYEYHLTERPDGTIRVTWQDLIERYSAVYNLDPAFVTAIIRNESSFRTKAESSVGARGLMQMMPTTAEWIAGKLGDSYDFDRLYEAETAIRYGCWYLGYLSDIFQGDTVLVCAAYHAGQGEVWSWLGDASISPDGVTVPIENIPIENTRIYAGRVTKAYGIYKAYLYPEPAPSADVPGAGNSADPQSSAVR